MSSQDHKIPNDVIRKATAAGAELRSSVAVEIIKKLLMAERRQAATIGYKTCAETHHVSLGFAVEKAIMEGWND